MNGTLETCGVVAIGGYYCNSICNRNECEKLFFSKSHCNGISRSFNRTNSSLMNVKHRIYDKNVCDKNMGNGMK